MIVELYHFGMRIHRSDGEVFDSRGTQLRTLFPPYLIVADDGRIIDRALTLERAKQLTELYVHRAIVAANNRVLDTLCEQSPTKA